jgi:oligopeptide transport system substrate-binding protein
MLYEGLFRSSQTGAIEQALVESFTISADKKTVIFKLKKTYWSDGTPVTAYDFESSWLYQLDPKNPSPYAYLFYPIKSAEQFKLGVVSRHELGLTVVDSQTLKLELHTPQPDLYELLSFSTFFPYKQNLANGPYKIKSYKPHQEILLIKNECYHDKEKIEPHTLLIKLLDSNYTAMQLFKNGELDLIGGPLAPIPLEELKTRPADYIQPMAGATLLAFNTRSPLFSNLNLRQAFFYALDFEKLATLTPLKKTPPASFLPYIQHSRAYQPTFSKQKAHNHLHQALQELGLNKNDLNKIKYFVSSKIDSLQLAQTLQAEWKNNLDLDITLAPLEQNMLAAKLADKEFELMQVAWVAPSNSPSALVDRFLDPTLAKNFSSYTTPHLSDLIQSLDDENTPEILTQLDDELKAAVPFIPLDPWVYPYYTSPNITQLNFTTLGTLNYTFLKIAKQIKE